MIKKKACTPDERADHLYLICVHSYLPLFRLGKQPCRQSAIDKCVIGNYALLIIICY